MIAAWDADDKRTPPATGGVVITGSSSAAFWPAADPFVTTFHPVIRGFSGSEASVNIYFAERLSVYKPRYFIIYIGENDVNNGRTPEEAKAALVELVRRVRFYLPDTNIINIAIKPSPSRFNRHVQMEEANRFFKEWITAQNDPKLTFIDTYAQFIGTDGQPRPELYQADKLHLTLAGYAIWSTELLKIIHIP